MFFITLPCIFQRLHAIGMLQKQGNWFPYEFRTWRIRMLTAAFKTIKEKIFCIKFLRKMNKSFIIRVKND